MKKYILSVLVLVILSSCGEGELTIEDKGNNLAVIPNKINEGVQNIPVNNSEENLIVKDVENLKLDKDNILSKELDFYMFNNKNLDLKIKEIEEEIKKIKEGRILKTDSNGIEFTVETYKNYKLSVSENSDGDILVINNEILNNEFLIENLSIANFKFIQKFDEKTGENEQIKVNQSTANKNFKKVTENLEYVNKLLIEEKEALDNGLDLSKYIYEDKIILEELLQNILLKYNDLIKKREESKSITKIKQNYLKFINDNGTQFDIKEVNYLFISILKNKDALEENYEYIDKSEMENIIKNFENGKLVNIEKKFEGNIKISSEILYSKNIDDEGNTFYIDETFYLKAKKSLKNNYEKFITYKLLEEEELSTPIYYFLTGIDEKLYFHSIIENIINNVPNDLFIQLTNSSFIEQESNEGIIYRAYTGKPEIDILDKGIMKKIFGIILGEIEINNYNKYQLEDLLINVI